MTILGKILHGLGHFFTDLFSAYEKAWTKLEPQIQMVLVQGVGICEVIKTNLDANPQVIFDIIHTKFPQVTPDQIKAVINAIAKDIDTSIEVVDADPTKTLTNIIAFLKTLKGTALSNTLSTIAQLASMFLGKGAGLNWSTCIMFVEFVYTNFFKAKA